MRSRSGHNDNPTAMGFRRNLQYSMMITLLVPPVGTNCLPDAARLLISDFNKCTDDEVIEVANDNEIIDSKINEWFINDDRDAINMDEQQLDKQEEEQATDFQKCSKKYVAGYLALKCITKFNCEKCKNVLLDNDVDLNSHSDLLLLWKAYPSIKGKLCGSLKCPKDSFFLIILTAYEIFEKEFSKCSHMKKIGQYLFELIKQNIIKKNYHFWADDCCLEHRDYIIRLFIRTHIFNRVKWITKDFRDKNTNKRVSNDTAPRSNKKLSKLNC